MDRFTFRTEHPNGQAFAVLHEILGKLPKNIAHENYKGHEFWRISYTPDFNLASFERQIRQALDRVEWLFVTTAARIELRGETLVSFGIAPILPRKIEIAYHATRACLISKICGENGEGLLPSNAERRATYYPDTEGVIHVCEKLTDTADENGSAEWWMRTLSKKNNFNDQNWGIVRIDMTQLPPTARIYEDMHSYSGVIVDRIDRIPGKLVSPVDTLRETS